jgi:NAD+ synthase
MFFDVDIQAAVRRGVPPTSKPKGIVVDVSAGVDCAVVAANAARALGSDRVLALLMPERDSSPESLELGKMIAAHFGIRAIVEDIAPALEAIGCYRRQDEAIRSVFPEYDPEAGYRFKLSDDVLTVSAPDGTEHSASMSPDAHRQLVAATNYKHRLRKAMEHYHADRLGYVVAATLVLPLSVERS